MDKNFNRGFGCMVRELIAWIAPGSPTAPDGLPQTVADLVAEYQTSTKAFATGLQDESTTICSKRVGSPTSPEEISFWRYVFE